MNFNKNNNRNKNSRFGQLKTEETNNFKTSSRNNSNKSREQDTKDGRFSRKNTGYAPPSQRGKKKQSRSRFKREEPKKKPELISPDVKDGSLFPTLGSSPSEPSNQKEKSVIAKDDSHEEKVVKEKPNEDKKSLWSSIINHQSETVKEEDNEYVPAGWVRMRYDKIEKRIVYTYGPESKEHAEFMARIEADRKAKEIRAWDKRIKEYEEDDIFWGRVDNYYYSWQAADIDADRALDKKIAQMELELENGTYWDEEEKEDEFYEDEY